jgi:hypothetical protein
MLIYLLFFDLDTVVLKILHCNFNKNNWAKGKCSTCSVGKCGGFLHCVQDDRFVKFINIPPNL